MTANLRLPDRSSNSRVSGSACPGRGGFYGFRRLLVVTSAVALFLLVVSVNTTIALKFDQLKVFNEPDVLFHSDANWRLNCFMRGDGGMGRSLMHPNLCNFVHPVVLTASKVVREVAPSLPFQSSRRASTRFFALLVSPVASGLAVCILFKLGTVLGLTLKESALLALLYAGSFSQLVFASAPDHFALGGLSMCLTLYLAALTVTQKTRSILPWIGVAAFAGSITIVLAPVVILVYGTSRLPSVGFKRMVTGVAAVGGATVIVIFGVYFASAPGTTKTGTTLDSLMHWASFYYSEIPAHRKLAEFPSSIASAVASAGVRLTEQPEEPFKTKPPPGEQEQGRYDTMFVMDRGVVPETALTLVIVASTIWWLVDWLTRMQRRGQQSPVVGFYTCCFAILAFNGVFHAFWGVGYFLYSQHWLAASLCPMILAVVAKGWPDRRLKTGLFGCLVVAVYVNNHSQLERMIMLLEQTPVG